MKLGSLHYYGIALAEQNRADARAAAGDYEGEYEHLLRVAAATDGMNRCKQYEIDQAWKQYKRFGWGVRAI